MLKGTSNNETATDQSQPITTKSIVVKMMH